MIRFRAISIVIFAGLVFLAPGSAQDKKKGPGAFAGKIIQVHMAKETKKVEALTVEVKAGEITERKVRLDEQTKIEYSGIVNKDDYTPRIGFSVDVKLRAGSDLAASLKISPTSAKAPGKKKADKK